MTKRARKFEKKIVGDVQKQRFDAQKEFMVKQEAAATKDLVRIEGQVKQICPSVSVILLPYYIIFAKEIYKKQKIFKAQTLINEIEILQEKWRSRGLNTDLLANIKLFYVEAYRTLMHFKLDYSLLDGIHVLA